MKYSYPANVFQHLPARLWVGCPFDEKNGCNTMNAIAEFRLSNGEPTTGLTGLETTSTQECINPLEIMAS